MFNSEFEQAENKQFYLHRNPLNGIETRLRGIVKLQKSLFYASYDYETCVASDKKRKFKNALMGVDTIHQDTCYIDTAKFEAAAKYSVVKFGQRGLNEGQMVDDHVTLMINGEPIIDTQDEYPVDEDAFIMMKKAGMTVSRTTIRRSHPLSQKFIKFMLSSGYEPLAAQVVVGDNELGIATAIDSVWRKKSTGKIALVELKKYNRNYYCLSNDVMRKPYHETERLDEHGNFIFKKNQDGSESKELEMDELTNCPLNQHQLQLGWGYKLWNISLGEFEVSEAFIIQVDGGTPQRYDLQEWAIKNDTWNKALLRMAKLNEKLNIKRAIKLKQAIDEKARHERYVSFVNELKLQAVEEKNEEKKQIAEEKKAKREADKKVLKSIKNKEKEAKKRQRDLQKELKQQERKKIQEDKKEAKRKEMEAKKKAKEDEKAKQKAEKLSIGSSRKRKRTRSIDSE